MNIVSQTESRTLLQHYSFENSLALHVSGVDKESQEQTALKLSSVREFEYVKGCGRTSVLF